MVRRSLLHEGPDQRAVKWCLVAAVFALSVGVLAEVAVMRSDVAQETTPVDTAAVTTKLAT